MAVHFNVVGIFLRDKPIDIGGGEAVTVKDVMDAAKQQLKLDPIFNYTSMQDGTIVNSIMAYYPHGVTSRSNKFYPKGVYRLGQTFTMPTPNPYSVWQYYLFDEKGVRQPVKDETSYTISKVKDGWKIVWRLVTICNAPTGLSHRLEKMLPAGTLTTEMF